MTLPTKQLDGKYHVFVDASFREETASWGFGVVMLTDDPNNPVTLTHGFSTSSSPQNNRHASLRAEYIAAAWGINKTPTDSDLVLHVDRTEVAKYAKPLLPGLEIEISRKFGIARAQKILLDEVRAFDNKITPIVCNDKKQTTDQFKRHYMGLAHEAADQGSSAPESSFITEEQLSSLLNGENVETSSTPPRNEPLEMFWDPRTP